MTVGTQAKAARPRVMALTPRLHTFPWGARPNRGPGRSSWVVENSWLGSENSSCQSWSCWNKERNSLKSKRIWNGIYVYIIYITESLWIVNTKLTPPCKSMHFNKNSYVKKRLLKERNAGVLKKANIQMRLKIIAKPAAVLSEQH